MTSAQLRMFGVAASLLLAAAVALGTLHAPAGPVAHGATVFPRLMTLVAVLSIAWLVWTLPPWTTLTFAVVLSPLASNWRQVGIPGALAPDRLLLVGGIAVVLVRAPAARGRPPLRLTPTHGLLGILLAYAIVSAAAVGTLFQSAGFFRLFDAFGVLPFLVFLVAPVVFASERARAALLAGLVVLGAYLGFTALCEAVKLDALVWPRFIVDSTATDTTGRAYGVFLEPVSNGAGLFDCGVAAVVAYVAWRDGRARVFAAVTAMLCAAGAFFTLERSVWLGAGAAIVVTGIAAAARARRVASGMGATLALVAAAVVIAGVALRFAPGLAHDASQRAGDQGTVYDRRNLARAAENMIAARPLFGFGWSTFERRSLEYFQQSPDIPLNPNLAFTATNKGSFSVHNAFLDYGVTLGLVGATLWLLGIALAVGGALRAHGPPDLERWRFALLPVVVFYLVIENAVPPALFPNLALWLWLGVVWAGYAGMSADGHDAELAGRARVQ